jgi:uncharacterized membrane protein
MNKKVVKPFKKILLPEDHVKPEQITEGLHSAEAKFAQAITDYAGSMPFIYIHAVWFTFWILANYGALKPLIPEFDPFPYGLLTMIVSLEAIFLSAFIMVAQNRQALVDTVREIEDDQEQKEDEKEQDALEEDVEDIQEDVEEIQDDLGDIKKALELIQTKITNMEHTKLVSKSSK